MGLTRGGCSNGSFGTTVGIVDGGFHNTLDLLPNIQGGSAAFSFPVADSSHGTFTSSILAPPQAETRRA